MKYYVADFHIEGAEDIALCKEILTALTTEIGFESYEEDETGLHGYIQQELFDEHALRDLLANFPVSGVSITYTVKEMEDKDWNEPWEQAGFEPIVIGNRCVIHDAQHPVPDTLHPEIDITIEARQAFGTGTHETTRMIVEQLLQMDLKGKRVLDCGCGTGILGIVASKLGAGHVVGYDIDEWSVENTRHNALLNKVENIEVFEGDKNVLSHVSGVFDLVVANINRNILLEDMEAMKEVMSHDAQIILSGFYAEDSIMIAEKAGNLGLTLLETKGDNNWCMLIFGSSL